MSPRRFLICMVSASFVPNLAPLPFLAILQQNVAFRLHIIELLAMIHTYHKRKGNDRQLTPS